MVVCTCLLIYPWVPVMLKVSRCKNLFQLLERKSRRQCCFHLSQGFSFFQKKGWFFNFCFLTLCSPDRRLLQPGPQKSCGLWGPIADYNIVSYYNTPFSTWGVWKHIKIKSFHIAGIENRSWNFECQSCAITNKPTNKNKNRKKLTSTFFFYSSAFCLDIQTDLSWKRISYQNENTFHVLKTLKLK